MELTWDATESGGAGAGGGGREGAAVAPAMSGGGFGGEDPLEGLAELDSWTQGIVRALPSHLMGTTTGAGADGGGVGDGSLFTTTGSGAGAVDQTVGSVVGPSTSVRYAVDEEHRRDEQRLASEDQAMMLVESKVSEAALSHFTSARSLSPRQVVTSSGCRLIRLSLHQVVTASGCQLSGSLVVMVPGC
jgi:hypothetical protein